MKQIIKDEDYDILIPGTDIELDKISKSKKEIEAETNCKIIISDLEVIKIANDKYLTFQFLKKNNFNPPNSCLPMDLNKFLLTNPFPLIVKPRDGARSIGLHKVNTMHELKFALENSSDPIIQEYIDDKSGEMTAGTMTLEGSCYSSIILSRELRDGNTYKAKLLENKEANKFIRSVSETLNPFGPCNFQFRLDRFGMPRIFEINSRFSGTTELRTICGYHEVDWIINYISNDTLPPTLVSLSNFTFMRNFEVTSVPSDSIINSTT